MAKKKEKEGYKRVLDTPDGTIEFYIDSKMVWDERKQERIPAPVECIRIRSRTDSNLVVEKEVNDEIKKRYEKQYMAWKKS